MTVKTTYPQKGGIAKVKAVLLLLLYKKADCGQFLENVNNPV